MPDSYNNTFAVATQPKLVPQFRDITDVQYLKGPQILETEEKDLKLQSFD